MESPTTENKASIATTSSDLTATFQDSPIFSYINNLSPIRPVKAAPVAQGFPGLNSPPLVFTSPRVNPRQQSLDLKRGEISGLDYKGKHFITGVDEYEKSDSQLSCGLNPQLEKVPGCNSYEHDQTDSPTGCVDEYLAGLLVDRADSTHSANPDLKQSEGVSKLLNDSLNSKEPIEILAKKDDEQDLVKAVEAANIEQVEQGHREFSSSLLNPVEKDYEAGCVASSGCSRVEPNSPADHRFEQEHSEQPMAKLIHEYEECGETDAEVVLDELAMNVMMHASKASQNQLGKRRRLQFEEAQQNLIAENPVSWKPLNSAICSRSPGSPDDAGILDSSSLDIPATPNNVHLGTMTPSKTNKNSVVTVSKPSGIGLHLNSIVNALPTRVVSAASTKSAERRYISVKARTEGHKNESQVSTSTSSASCPSPYRTKPPLHVVEQRKTYEQVKAISEEHDCTVEELNQSSPKKKRKKAPDVSDGDGCKRCNCKKTKCLKLYCDCFAAGIYCADPCACQGCFNRPEYEDTVLETRQQIESRNPMAFSPKIIQCLTQPPANRIRDDGDRSTPPSGRHKKGCNCKKSMCLKKYCECYQANVGCSEACRCEACKNIHGRKEEYGIRREVGCTDAVNEKVGGLFGQTLETVATTGNYLLPEFRNPHCLTPLTPSFQHSDHGKDASKSRLLSERYCPSPEPSTFLAPNLNAPGSPKTSPPPDLILETRTEIFGLESFDQESDYSKVEDVGEFLPKCRKLGNICHLNTLPNYSTSETRVSSGSAGARDYVNVSRTQFYPGSVRFSSVNSSRLRSSPVTPVSLFTETKHKQVYSDEGLYDILEDDTPEILKETPAPPNPVKVSSPNKKRISPPHSCLNALGSSSLTGLKSGRKFILKAVPSFPPLSPGIDLKDGVNYGVNDHQTPRNNNE